LDERRLIHLEKLAGLQLESDERRRLLVDLAQMATLVARLPAGGGPLMVDPVIGSQRPAPQLDSPDNDFAGDLFLARAPHHDAGFFVVPAVRPENETKEEDR